MKKNTQAAAEQKESKLPLDGTYIFEVKGADDKPSANGDDMYSLRMNIYDEEGKKRIFKTWVGGWDLEKVQGFFDSIGGELLDKYNAEENVDAFDLVGAKGRFKLKRGVNKKRNNEPVCNVQFFVPLRDGENIEIPELQEAEPFAPTSDDEVPF